MKILTKNIVINCFKHSIKQSNKTVYHSESGKITMQIDEELKGQIHTEMMKAILKFEIRVK